MRVTLTLCQAQDREIHPKGYPGEHIKSNSHTHTQFSRMSFIVGVGRENGKEDLSDFVVRTRFNFHEKLKAHVLREHGQGVEGGHTFCFFSLAA